VKDNNRHNQYDDLRALHGSASRCPHRIASIMMIRPGSVCFCTVANTLNGRRAFAGRERADVFLRNPRCYKATIEPGLLRVNRKFATPYAREDAETWGRGALGTCWWLKSREVECEHYR
jgi:hypothetical protein